MASAVRVVAHSCASGDSPQFVAALKLLVALSVSGCRPQVVTELSDQAEHLSSYGTRPLLEVVKTSQVFFEADAAVRYLLRAKDKLPLVDEESKQNAVIEWADVHLQKAMTDKSTVETALAEAEKRADSLFHQEKLNPVDVILFAILYPIVVGSSPCVLDSAKHAKLSSWFAKVATDPRVRAGVRKAEGLVQGKIPSPVVAAELTAARKVNPAAIAETPFPGYVKLPSKDRQNVLVTSALPYVNNVPHLGNIIGSTLSADVFARYNRLRKGTNVLYICGTDEYGTATETKALEDNVSCQELCDKYYAIHKETYEWFDIGFDYFGRTTTAKQTEIAQDMFMKCWRNGYLKEDDIVQLYCEKCNRFLADRYVEGTCPKCKYEDARGDQCDHCGTLLNAHDLVNPRCKLDSNRPITKASRHVFLELDKLQPQCEKWFEKTSVTGRWSNNGIHITRSWLKEGLKPRCITRDLKWGTPVPLNHMRDKVFYVWFDAPIGYLSITANYTDWEAWWKNPRNVKLYQFMGKDNVPFHSVIFPSSELATKDDFTLVHHVNTAEYLQYEGDKFSKSRNRGVFGTSAKETDVGVSVWRYYLLSVRPESQDSSFQWHDFVAKNNSELLANFGNFCNRVLKFIDAKYDGVMPDYTAASEDDLRKKLSESVHLLLREYNEALELGHLRHGLQVVMQVSARGNHFLQESGVNNALFANHPERCAAAIGAAANLIYLLAALVHPYMPSTAADVCAQVNAPQPLIPDSFMSDALLPGHRIGKPRHLFTRIAEEKAEEWRQQFAG